MDKLTLFLFSYLNVSLNYGLPCIAHPVPQGTQDMGTRIQTRKKKRGTLLLSCPILCQRNESGGLYFWENCYSGFYLEEN